MANLDSLYAEMDSHIKSLDSLYLDRHIKNSLARPDEYNLDVKSYCILSHAAMEDFAETLAATVMSFAIDAFINTHTISESLIALMHFKANGESHLSKQSIDDKHEQPSSFDYIRITLNEVKARFSSEIFNNHGVSLKYLKQLMLPVAIDIPKDENQLNSLQILARARGSYAHKFLDGGTVSRSLAPEDARVHVGDCLLFFEELKNKAKVRMV